MKNSVYFNLVPTGEGVHRYEVISAQTDRVVASYDIIDYSDDTGCMYVVQRTENPAKALRCDTIVQAQAIARADYMARV